MRKKKWSVKALSCILAAAMVLTTVIAMPTMNAEAATKKAAMSKTSVTLIVDKTCTLSVNNAKGKAAWSTSDKKIAAVSQTGDRSAKVTAKKTGTATITAKIGNKKYTCKVKVENPKLSATSKTLNTKDAKTATIQLNSTSQGSSVKWSTSNSKVVSIKASKNKVTMTAKKAGSATVTATLGGKKFSCKVTVETSHNYKKVKTVAATCSKKRYTEYKCACGKSYKKEIKATGKHDYSVKKNTVAATCTEDGYTVYKCKNCDKTTKKIIKATGHQYGEWVVVKEAAATEDGLRSRTCSVCGDVVEEVIPATGETEHTWGEWETVIGPSCENPGEEKRTCETCGKEETREIPATGHTWGEWNLSKEPSCEEEGYYIRTCSFCNQNDYDYIPATGHSYDYDGEKEGYKWVEEAEKIEKDIEVQETVYTCSGCGMSSSNEGFMEDHMAAIKFGEAAKHEKDDGSVLITSTRTVTKHLAAQASGHYEKVEGSAGGEKLYVCSKCDNTYTESI